MSHLGESSHGTKELYNLPSLVLDARHLGGHAVPERAQGWFPLGLGLVVEVI